MEAQVTYPLVTGLLGAPKVKTVRGISDFGLSFVYVIFEDGTDLYWARSRIQELLAGALASLPPGVKTELGPDATSLGWVYQYVLRDDSGRMSLAELRSTQDYYLRYHLRSVPVVAEVASLGGFVPQYQITVNAARLRALGIPLSNVVNAVRMSNVEATGRVLELSGSEYIVHGHGYLENPHDLEEVVVSGDRNQGFVRIKDIGQVSLGPEMRRGVADWNGQGESVGGIVVMRQGANALTVINAVKHKLEQIGPGLPTGVRVMPVYDRSGLIQRVVKNCRTVLVEITITVVVVILLFLRHLPSAAVPVVMIPLTLLIVAGLFHTLGISFDAMSLGGLAAALGALVDAAIIMVEQTHKKLEVWQTGGCCSDEIPVIIGAVKEVGRPAFYALVIMSIAFLPVLALEGQNGRLFRPLVYAKSLTILVAALLSISLDPALRVSLARLGSLQWSGRWWSRPIKRIFAAPVIPEEQNRLSRLLISIYQPALLCALNNKAIVSAAVLLIALITVPISRRLTTEFMPPLDEGTLLYMPSTVPGISITTAKQLLQITDARLKRLPEVAQVLGKAGRADTATDVAPLSMLETLVVLKPHEQWEEKWTWYTSWAPGWLKLVLRHITSDRLSPQELVRKFDAALQIPGVTNTWTMPVRGRIDMLTTGMRTPLGIKVCGSDLNVIQKIGTEIVEALKPVSGTRNIFAERVGEGLYVDVRWDRTKLANLGISMEEAQTAIQNAIGGENITTAVIGRARYPVNVRLPRDSRANLEDLRRVPVTGAAGVGAFSLGQIATVTTSRGPSMIRDENGLLTGYIYIDLDGRDPHSYMAEAKSVLSRKIKTPEQYSLFWSGEYEAIERTNQRLWQIVPLTVLLVAALLYCSTRSITKLALILLAVPFSAIGAVWSLYLLSYPMSPATWIGIIALIGIDAETGTFMLLYLDLAYEGELVKGKLKTWAGLRKATLAGAVRRIRPKFMTVATMFVSLLPVLWSNGEGAEVMKRIAAPVIGGIATSFVMELFVYPLLYEGWKARSLAGLVPGSGFIESPRQLNAVNDELTVENMV